MAEVRATPWNGLTHVSSFSCAGGTCAGLREAGFKTLLAVESDRRAQASYRANFPDAALLGDIRKVTAPEILATTGLAVGELDLFEGSPPCTVFSTAGRRQKKWGVQKHKANRMEYIYAFRAICKTEVPMPAGGSVALVDWRVADIVTDTVERFREIRLGQGRGIAGVTHHMQFFRALLNWGIRAGHIDATPFKRGTETVVKLAKGPSRSRWLEGGVPLHTIKDWLGHTNIAQTSTYLAGTMKTQHEAMRRYEESLALQQTAKGSGRGGRKGQRKAKPRPTKPNKTAVGRNQAIM